MNCFPCCGPKKSNSMRENDSTPPEPVTTKSPADMKKPLVQNVGDPANINAQAFTFRELATATKNFRQDSLIDEGGFGRIYKGIIPATGQAVAVKQLDRNGMQSSKEFLAEIAELSLLHHENLVNLIGYCADGDQRLLVYELFPGRSLENRLFDHKAEEGPLSWYERMKVVTGASKGLEYLHETANPPVIFRDLKSSSILVDNDFQAKLCEVGMAKLAGGDKMSNAPPRLMGTYGHYAPEYVRSGQLSMKSDVYSFGVIMLELITGRRALDTTRPNDEQNLVSWATPLFRDPKKYPDMADPRLNKNFPDKDLNQVVAMASMCLQEEPEARPLISDVVTALSFLSVPPPAPVVPQKIEAVVSQRVSECGSGESGSESGSCRSSVDESKHKSKQSRKSSSKSSKKSSDSSEDGHKKSSRKSIKDLIKKGSRKNSSSAEDLVKKSSSVEDLSKEKKKSTSKKSSRKSSRKFSGKVLSHKSSMASEDGSSMVSSSCRSSSVGSESDEGVQLERSSMKLSQGSSSHSSMHLIDHACSMGSDEGSDQPFDRTSSSGSSVYSR